MEFISKCTADTISNAAQALKDGHLVAFPTETVYGLGADATNEKAVSRIYSVKGRPVGHPLIVHISSINKLEVWATDIPEFAIKLAREFWPGPMTLILLRTDLAKDFITGGQNSIGLRVPAQPVALALIKKFEELGGNGIAAPSANRFGAVSPTTAEAVGEELGDYLDSADLVLDGGQSLVGIESTIIDCTGLAPRVLRPGAITEEMIEQTLKKPAENSEGKSEIKAPGLLDSHYAPRAKVKINSNAKKGEGYLALSDFPTPAGAVRLASPSTIEEYARDLYESFRLADKLSLAKINVVVPEGSGIAHAIRDRIYKASNQSKKFSRKEELDLEKWVSRVVDIFRQAKMSLLNLFDILVSVLSRKITIGYGIRRLKSQLFFVGKRFIDGVNWEKYHKDYIEELRLIRKTNTLLINTQDIELKNRKIVYKNENILPLLVGHKLLYETILNLQAKKILEVGVGGGDHLYNLHQLNEDLKLFGIDRSKEQLRLFEKRHQLFYKQINTNVKDLTELHLELPKVDLIFSQAVLMHISEKDDRFFAAFKNMFTESNSYIVLMENWTQHNFFEAAQEIIEGSLAWSAAKLYLTHSEIEPSVKCMVISKNDLDLECLTNYDQLLSGRKLMIH